MDEVTLNGRLLRGKSIRVEKIQLIPLTIDEILDEDVGFDLYNRYLSILCMDSDDIKEMLNIEDDTEIDPFEYLCINCYQDEVSKEYILKIFNLFLREQVNFYADNVEAYFYLGDIQKKNQIDKNNFSFIIEILKKQNCIEKSKDKTKPENDAQKKFFAQLKKMREKYAKYKEVQDIVDIMSAVCSKHPSINVFNVGELTIYQLIDTYKRLNLIDEYFLNIKSLLAGADSKEIKLKHWGVKIL